MALTRDALLAAVQLPRERVDVPELGGFVIVQGMTGVQRDAWERSLLVGRGRQQRIDTNNVRAKLAVQCLVTEDGQRLFSDDDAEALGKIRVDVLQRIFETAQRLSGVSDGDLDELKKSSGAAASSGSPTN